MSTMINSTMNLMMKAYFQMLIISALALCLFFAYGFSQTVEAVRHASLSEYLDYLSDDGWDDGGDPIVIDYYGNVYHQYVSLLLRLKYPSFLPNLEHLGEFNEKSVLKALEKHYGWVWPKTHKSIPTSELIDSYRTAPFSEKGNILRGIAEKKTMTSIDYLIRSFPHSGDKFIYIRTIPGEPVEWTYHDESEEFFKAISKSMPRSAMPPYYYKGLVRANSLLNTSLRVSPHLKNIYFKGIDLNSIKDALEQFNIPEYGAPKKFSLPRRKVLSLVELEKRLMKLWSDAGYKVYKDGGKIYHGVNILLMPDSDLNRSVLPSKAFKNPGDTKMPTWVQAWIDDYNQLNPEERSDYLRDMHLMWDLEAFGLLPFSHQLTGRTIAESWTHSPQYRDGKWVRVPRKALEKE